MSDSQDEPGARTPCLPQLGTAPHFSRVQERGVAGSPGSLQPQTLPDPVDHRLLTLMPLKASGVCPRQWRVRRAPA